MDRNARPTRGTQDRYRVALRKESVDRNHVAVQFVAAALAVALRKESVDRNHIGNSAAARPSVALRKESVDRNREVFGIPYSAVSRSPQGERG